MSEHDRIDQLTREELAQKLRQREAELAILTGVQLGLVDRLDVQAIYDLVGDRIREIFDPDVVMLSTYDADDQHRRAPLRHRDGRAHLRGGASAAGWFPLTDH